MPKFINGKNTTKGKQFLKWAGGKQQLLPELAKYIPKSYGRYFEPFLGSGAYFFNVIEGKAFLSDINEDLINCYQVVKNDVEKLIESLKKHENTSEYFYQMRATDTDSLDKLERASRFIFLNRTCFNGLYRVNKSGKFNVPFGKYKNPNIVQEDKLKLASLELKRATIVYSDYKKVLKKAKKNDFIYLDPPYFPLSDYSDFKRYNKEFFYKEDHKELAKIYKELDKLGCKILLSNSDTEFTRDLYKEWNIKTVTAKRMINCIASKRGNVNEILVTNYEI